MAITRGSCLLAKPFEKFSVSSMQRITRALRSVPSIDDGALRDVAISTETA